MTNYPDSTHSCDRLAPWNRPEPWESETCGTCRWLRQAEVFGRRCTVCVHPDADLVTGMAACAPAMDCWEAR